QGFVEAPLHFVNRLEQIFQTLQGKRSWFNRYQHAIGSIERSRTQVAEGRHTVDEDEVIGVSKRVEPFTEAKNDLKIPIGNFGESNIGPDQLQMLLYLLGMHWLLCIVIEGQDIRGKCGGIVEQSTRKVPLGVVVDSEGVIPACRQTLGEIQGNGGF